MIEQAELTMQPDLGFLDISDEGIEVEDDENSSDDQGDDPIVEPFDPTLIRVAAGTSTADLLISRLRNNEINLAPGFQRRGGIWNNQAQSRLIESMLIKIPLPAFYMDATDEDNWLVVDGLQRLTTFKRFVISQELRLKGMEFLSQLNGKTFSEIPRSFQRRILETQITVFLIEKGTPSGVKFNIFRRINTGGLPLSPQEIRHALNQGPVTELLRRLASSPEFKTATNNGVRSDRMADFECVLRFFAFVLTPYEEYRAKVLRPSGEEYRARDFDSFLNDAMKAVNAAPQQERDALERRFRRAMIAAFSLFGPYTFRKRVETRALPINNPLFEIWSVSLDKLSDIQLQTLITHKSQVQEKMFQLLKDVEFSNSISLHTSDTNNVKIRFRAVENLINEVLK